MSKRRPNTESAIETARSCREWAELNFPSKRPGAYIMTIVRLSRTVIRLANYIDRSKL